MSILQLSGWEPLPHLCMSHKTISLFHRMVFCFDVKMLSLFTAYPTNRNFHVKKIFAHTHTDIHADTYARPAQTLHRINATERANFQNVSPYYVLFKIEVEPMYSMIEPTFEMRNITLVQWSEREIEKENVRDHKHSSYVLWLYVNLFSFT